MATIDNLWDEPVESEPAPHLSANPIISSEDPLFLQSESDNEGRRATAGPRPSKAPDDIGTLFDVGDDDENGQLSNVTYEQLRKDALSGGKASDDDPSNGENQGTKEGPLKGGSTVDPRSNKKGEDGSSANTKRTIPKLNEELLLSYKGIPALIEDAKRWRPKGKGHEISDLNRLIRTYQYWAHQMYPRHTFNDTIERVEKLTHSRRMHVALSVWHDEVRAISRHQPINIDGVDSSEGGRQAGASDSRQTPEPPTRPPSSASERASDAGGDSDMDVVPGTTSTGTQGGGDEFDFEVEMWDDIPFVVDPTSTSSDPKDTIANLQKPSTKLPVLPLDQGEDQGMWDLVDELQAQEKATEDVSSPKGSPASLGDDDWDSMYA